MIYGYTTPLYDFNNVVFLSGPIAEHFARYDEPDDEEQTRRNALYDLQDKIENSDIRITFTRRVIVAIRKALSELSERNRTGNARYGDDQEQARLLSVQWKYCERLNRYLDQASERHSKLARQAGLMK